MENPFETIDRRLEAIKHKLEGLIQRIDNLQLSSPTWVVFLIKGILLKH